MKQDPCPKCLIDTDLHVPSYYDPKQKVQYVLCLKCMKETQLGLYRKRVEAVGVSYDQR